MYNFTNCFVLYCTLFFTQEEPPSPCPPNTDTLACSSAPQGWTKECNPEAHQVPSRKRG